MDDLKVWVVYAYIRDEYRKYYRDVAAFLDEQQAYDVCQRMNKRLKSVMPPVDAGSPNYEQWKFGANKVMQFVDPGFDARWAGKLTYGVKDPIALFRHTDEWLEKCGQ